MSFNLHASAFNDPMTLAGAKPRTALEVIAEILPMLWPKDQPEMRVRVVISVACLFLGRTANVYGPIVLKNLVDGLEHIVRTNGLDRMAEDPALGAVFGLALMYGAMVFIPSLLTEIRAAIFTPVSESAQRVFALRAFDHLHRLSMRFHLDRRTGGLSSAIERGTGALQQLTGMFAFNIAPTLFEIGVVCIYLAYGYPLKYVWVILAAVVAYIAFTLFYTEWRTKYRRMMIAEENRATSIGVDSLLNFETVKYFSNEHFESARYDDALQKYMVAAVKSQTTLGVLNVGQILVRVLCQVTILMLAIGDYGRGTLSTGEVVMLNTFMLQLFIPLGFLGSSYRMIRQAFVDMEFMFQLLDLAPDIKDRPDAKRLVVLSGKVAFKNVRFGYDARRRVIDEISFTIPPGTTTAIVGPSGAGKSTLARLLYRFYDIDAGSISVDGTSIDEVTQVSLREAVGIVPQDTVLFNETIRYNIRYGRPDATDEEVEHAARLASIHDFITSLPAGYETRVGERGLKLSGGEKQRVAIARTVLKDPPILVLDEATSALDIHTEREIQGALKEVSRNRTTMVIAHRLSTIVHADQILVLDGGRIVERGSHAGLLEADGLYAAMWQRQKEVANEIEKIKETFGIEELRALQVD